MAKPPDDRQDQVLDEAVQQFLAAQLREEKPDLDAFVQQYPDLEQRIRQKVQACGRVSSLFDSLRNVQDGEIREAEDAADLVGKRIGAFQITEIIGRGGMGVVYKGRDSRLERIVAVKAMPTHLREDATAQIRFRREARLLASLSHPNIGAIHDIIEQADGVDYLILEYVPGETLAERIARGALRIPEVLSVALQMAQAVATAHEHGIIHRDLKPGNIKVTPEGTIKVLDFGLAKAVCAESPDQRSTVTRPGRVVGTPAYMSPEQACGRPADHRTDIWSFGCVLYEMLTGHLPFAGATATDTLARIIERDPDWELLPQTTPANIRVLLRRCLAKTPSRRLQHMGDAVLELDETLNASPGEPTIGEPLTRGTRPGLRWLGLACLAGLAVGLTASSLLWNRAAVHSSSDSGAVSVRRTIMQLPEKQVLGIFHSTTFGVRRPAFDLSLDGSRLVYVARVDDTTQLFERLMDRYEVRPIPGTNGASSPFLSPDGQSVGFFADEKLKRVSLRGGDPVVLCRAAMARGGSWGGDGMIYFADAGGLRRVSADSGDAEILADESRPLVGGYPQVLPGAKAVLFCSKEDVVTVISLETRQEKVLVRGGYYARYVPTGHLVYARAGAIEAVPFDLATLEVAGPSVPVIEKMLLDSLNGAAQFAFSNNGLLVYAPGADTSRGIPTWVDRQGQVEPLSMPDRIYGSLKLSPDGKRLAIIARELQSSVYIYDVAQGTGTKLALEGDSYYPLWTPDSRRVVVSRRRETDEQWDLLTAPADGSSKAELLYSAAFKMAPYSWSPDGKLLALYARSSSWILPLDDRRELEPILETEVPCWYPAFSPDGKYIAYCSGRDGSFQIYVRPYPTMDRVVRISREFGEEPVWSARGDELFYRNRSKWMVVSISTEPEFVAGTPQVLFEGPYRNISGLSYDVTPDGQRLLVLQPQYDDSHVRELHVVTNWFEELKRLVPPPDAP
jgi:serine/threonine protein kinase/WD40 repeat protein